MNVRVLAPLLVSAALSAVPVERSVALQPESRFTLAVLPCTNIEITFKKFRPLLKYVQDATGLTLTIVVPGDMVEFETEVANGQVDFALQDPHTYQQSARYFDAASLLQTRAVDGSTSQSGVVVVRRGSGVTEIGQLRGRSVMFGPRISSPKWIAARMLFESRGVNVAQDLRAVNGGCCEDIAFAVAVGTVDGGVICDHFLGQHTARQKDLGVDPDLLAVIDRTPAVPTRIFAARRGVSRAALERIGRALLQLDASRAEHAEILASAEIRGFVATTEADYLSTLVRPTSRDQP